MKERRKSPRLKTRGLIFAQIGRQQFPVRDLSRTGARVRMAQPMQVGEKLQLSLTSERLLEPLKVSAVVRRKEPGHGIAVEFLEFPEADQWRLDLLLATIATARILVVDDDKEIRRLLTLLLEREKYEVLTAADGLEGLAKAVELRPDLIILDVAMPKLSGIELCQRLQADPGTARIPVMILTGSNDSGEFDAAQKLGVLLYAPKPFRPRELVSHVRMLLER